MDKRRARIVNPGEKRSGGVVYWMSRDQRAKDNWALVFSAMKAREQNASLSVLFCLVDGFLDAAPWQYRFMLEGLKETEDDLKALDIPFHLVMGKPGDAIPKFIEENRVGALVTDSDPLRVKRSWKAEVSRKIAIPFYEVDAHNIVPCWLASGKKEFSTHTFRRKVSGILGDFLTGFPRLRRQGRCDFPDNGMEKLIRKLPGPQSQTFKSGPHNAGMLAKRFLKEGLKRYDGSRNDPNAGAQSDLSPYLHFGQISAQRIALEASKAGMEADGFLDELIIRRELSDNFCFYERRYDSFSGFHPWAQKTLDEHRGDRRDYLYTLQEFEKARTHDRLWNAAQLEMVERGKMHGYMRMYWAKKILEWTETPEQALDIAIRLNNKYELDGRDPNGYAGIAWSIGGVHDRAWGERKVFGKIRYMSYGGCRSKFDVDGYIDRWS